MNIDQFIRKWQGIRGGAERANYGQFINDFCAALDLPEPGVAEGGVLGAYQFDGPIAGGAIGGGVGFADLYKQGSFILEAKQSKLPEAQKNQPELFDVAINAPASPSGARYDRLMRDALAQAKRYAVNLPANHPWPPFLIVCDVGRAFELYFDWSGNGRGYGYFPDQQSYRFEIARFAEEDIRALFRAIWLDPASVDPRARAAEVSRAIARRLADVSKWLEGTQKQRVLDATDSDRSLAIEETALFLMRVIFCMFAEDVGLLPKRSFTEFLEKTLTNEAAFEPELEQLWRIMGRDGGVRYASAIGADVRYFNGGLFASAKTYTMSNADRGELLEAAKADWTKVEPAIFGTLLEQALTPGERAKLGAHYTPRPYVERLVQATIMDVLEAEWTSILSSSPDRGGGPAKLVEGHARPSAPSQGRDNAPVPLHPPAGGSPPRAGEDLIEQVTAFHDRLATIRVLDPACGTGNFLYVALENVMRLEADVIETIRQLGGHAEPRVGPEQFLGLELNPRAAVIAELVLWIGWLRWRMKNDAEAAPTPVLKQFGNINAGRHGGYDAVLRQKETGEPNLDSPTPSDWPQAHFIIGNPPFIGKGAAMRKALGHGYVEALHKAYPAVPTSVDLVMYWWERAATILTEPGTSLRRFGLVTTNLIKGSLNRKVILRHLSSEEPLSLVFSVPDHPWTKASKDAAAVRIAMSVAEAGFEKPGTALYVVREEGLKTDSPKIETEASHGIVHGDLSVGTDLTKLSKLHANRGLSSNGMMLAGTGFRVSRQEAAYLRSNDGQELPVRPYVGGNELMQRSQDRFVIDFFGLEETEVRRRFPLSYTRLLETVKPSRDKNRRSYRAERWWEFGENNPLMRDSLSDIPRYIGTTETTKHRVFRFLKSEIVPDHMIIGISLDDPFFLGVLSSEFHEIWTRAISSPLGVATKQQGHRYNKSQIFDPFPFPHGTPEQRAAIAELAEELDETRKKALAEVPGLTMTELYNLRERWRSGAEMDLIEQTRVQAARAPIVDRLHEQLDAAVAAAYGWPADLAPSEIVARLVALNHERAAEEKAGTIRWLRPDYQKPRFGAKS